MLGKLKVKGNIMLLQKLNSLWLELLKSGKAPEFPYIMELMSKTDLISGLRSEVMVIELIQRLIRLPYLCADVPTLIGFEILKDNKIAAQYSKLTSFRFICFNHFFHCSTGFYEKQSDWCLQSRLASRGPILRA